MTQRGMSLYKQPQQKELSEERRQNKNYDTNKWFIIVKRQFQFPSFYDLKSNNLLSQGEEPNDKLKYKKQDVEY